MMSQSDLKSLKSKKLFSIRTSVVVSHDPLSDVFIQMIAESGRLRGSDMAAYGDGMRQSAGKQRRTAAADLKSALLTTKPSMVDLTSFFQ